MLRDNSQTIECSYKKSQQSKTMEHSIYDELNLTTSKSNEINSTVTTIPTEINVSYTAHRKSDNNKSEVKMEQQIIQKVH